LRGDYGWRWPYEVPLQPFRLLPLVAGLAVYVLGARHLVRRRRAAWLLVWVIAASACLPIASIYVSASPFVKIQGITTGGVAGGWHYASIEITDLGTTLRDWPRFMERSHLLRSRPTPGALPAPGPVAGPSAACRPVPQHASHGLQQW